MEENQNYYITPPTVFMPKDGLRFAFVGTDTDWVDAITDNLEETFDNLPMSFYHLDDATKDNWSWLYLMVDQADLVMINTAKATTVELMTVMLHLGSKTWFYVDREAVEFDVQILLNSVGANVFNSSDQLHDMLRAFISNV